MFQCRTKIRTTLCAGAALLALGLPTALSASVPSISGDPGLRQGDRAARTDALRLRIAGRLADSAVLDWRQAETRLEFDLPPSDWVDRVTLRLSGDPVEGVAPGRIEMSLNDHPPTALDLDARGFRAVLDLDRLHLRPGRNVVRLALPALRGTCLSAESGGWDLDIARSDVRATLRPRARSVFLSEVESLLAQPTSRPRTLGIRASGPDAPALEALVAQGLALRMPGIPDYTLGTARDLTVLVGTRAELEGRIDDPSILDTRGPRVAVHDGHPLRLVITGDTPEEVRRGADAFATHRLPDARRRISGPGEMRLGPRLRADAPKLSGEVRLSRLGSLDFTRNGGASPDAVEFDIADPAASRASLSLDLRRADFVAPGSTVRISLNGRDLGTAALDQPRTLVTMAVPDGWLEGRNRLELTPGLNTVSTECGDRHDAGDPVPGLVVGPASRLTVVEGPRSSPGDLSRLAASGGLYADRAGAGTHVVLPEARGERETALRALGRMAVAAGGGLTAATYGPGDREGADLLVLADLPGGVEPPRAVSRVGGTRVASFPDGGRWVAHLDATSAASTRTLLAQWDDLSGGVSRLGGDAPDMVQTAFAGPERELSGPDTDRSPGFGSGGGFDPSALFDPEWGASVRLGAARSYVALREGWSDVDWSFAADVAGRVETVAARVVSRFRDEPALRGPYRAPEARAPDAAMAYTLMGDAHRVPAGVDLGLALRRLEGDLDRAAGGLRRATGIHKLRKVSWSWGDRHLSLPAMILMLMFLVCTYVLGTSENRIRK